MRVCGPEGGIINACRRRIIDQRVWNPSDLSARYLGVIRAQIERIASIGPGPRKPVCRVADVGGVSQQAVLHLAEHSRFKLWQNLRGGNTQQLIVELPPAPRVNDVLASPLATLVAAFTSRKFTAQ